MAPIPPPKEAVTFQDHSYLFVSEKLPWPEAKVKAEAMGGHLAVITSKEENDWIAILLAPIFRSGMAGKAAVCWIGASQPSAEKPWTWVTGEPMQYNAWGKNQPNRGNGDPQKEQQTFYAAFQYSTVFPFKFWNDLGLEDGGWKNIVIGFLVEWDDLKAHGPSPTNTTPPSAATSSAASATAKGDPWLVYPPKTGPGAGKHVVFLSGDEEYRSEESLPMLAKILSQRHGFKCTVLFAVDADGTINPENMTSLPGAEALDSADAIVLLTRYRAWPDAQMKHFADAYQRGVPIIGLRTATHAFKPEKSSNYASSINFGQNVFGSGWVNHWGVHKKEATLGIIEPDAKANPILRGVADIFGNSDVYEVMLPPDVKVLVRGQVLTGMNPNDPPATYTKLRADKSGMNVNNPMMPVAWTRTHRNPSGRTDEIFCTTMGAATDFENEDLRRLVVNAVYSLLGLEVPSKANVDYVGEYHPGMYDFKGYKKGVKPADLALPAAP